ncbi:MAG TPA: hypothetical protein VJN94_06150 [Candidatus Binataceae bacterium]|nr:hypothetical protein [Candidatus Binataceae bacterium]
MIVTLAAATAASPALAARVSGVLTGYETSTPLVSRDLHFENNVTGDVFLSPTHNDGSFAASLPPGDYSLRSETGAILVRSIPVERGRDQIGLGTVSELAPYAPQRLWQYQAIATSLLTSPAPSTAFILTADKTPLPSDATSVPKPEIDWSRPPPQTEASASGANAASGIATAPLPPAQPGYGTKREGPPPSPGTNPLYYEPPLTPQGTNPNTPVP